MHNTTTHRPPQPSSSDRTFELRQRGELDRGALGAVLRRALGLPLLLGLPHGLSREPVHLLGCRDGRHFDACNRRAASDELLYPLGQTGEGFLFVHISTRTHTHTHTETDKKGKWGANCTTLSSPPIPGYWVGSSRLARVKDDGLPPGSALFGVNSLLEHGGRSSKHTNEDDKQLPGTNDTITANTLNDCRSLMLHRFDKSSACCKTHGKHCREKLTE